MPYPDFLSSPAPNYAGQFTNIMRAQTEAKAEDMASWLKSVQAAKLAQDIQLEPQKEAMNENVQQATIDRSNAVTDRETQELPGKLTAQEFQNQLTEIAVKKAAADQADKQLAEEYTTKAMSLSPTDFPGEQGTDLLNEYVSKASDPNAIYAAQANIVKGNPAYGVSTAYAAERRLASPEARQTYDDALNSTGNMDQAMTALRLQSQKEAAQRAAEDAGAKAKAITEGQLGAGKGKLTPAMVNAAKQIDDVLNKDDNYVDLPIEQKLQIKSAVLQQVTKNGGTFDPKAIGDAIKQYSQPTGIDYYFGK